jgi:Ner family transcriptional regulator
MKEHTPPSKANWHPADIGAALKKRGWSYRRLSVHHGYSPTVFAAVVQRPWPKGERLIADAIGVPPAEIWPERYAARAEKAAARQRAALDLKARRSRKGC